MKERETNEQKRTTENSMKGCEKMLKFEMQIQRNERMNNKLRYGNERKRKEKKIRGTKCEMKRFSVKCKNEETKH